MSLLQGALSEGGGQDAAPLRPIAGTGRSGQSAQAGASTGWRSRLETALDAERGRLFLWLPVFFGAGVALYLSSPSEPPFLLVVAGVILASVLRMFLRATSLRLIISSAVFMFALGLAVAKFHAMNTDAPVLQRTLNYVHIEGWVERLERQEKRNRLTVRLIRAGDLPLDETPYRVRISIRGKDKPPLPGAAIKLRGTLMPPPEPAQPGGFDFARYYWFKGIGASGYAMSKIEPLDGTPDAPWDVRVQASIASVRHAVSDRIGAVLEGDRAAIAKALAVGERAEISEDTQQALRDSGLAHVIAISGFHMALMAGAVFWLIRAALALFPAVALRYPIRIWAAAAALVIASFYLALSGASVTAIRAYIMVSIAFLAIMLNRPAISQRNLAFAALLILALMPQSLLEAGFQMSFAATAALIGFYERRVPQRRFQNWPVFAAFPLIFLTEIGLTTVFASLAVDPLAAYHFHRVAIYSVIGNILAIPVVTLVIMPLVLLTLIAIPLGLEALPLTVMFYGLDAMLGVARFTAGLPGAAAPVPAFPDGALTLIIAGGLWLIIWTGRWRWWGLAAVGAGLAFAPFGERPDIWVDREGKLVAIRNADGLIETTKSRKASFSLERWMEADGDNRPIADVRGSKAFQCDEASCVAMVKGKLMSYVQHPEALAEDCRRVDILIATIPVAGPCQRPEIIIDRLSLREHGAHTLKITGSGIVKRTVSDVRGERPWVITYHRRERIPETFEDPDDQSQRTGEN
jgi:competence protein ComEC